MENRSKPSPVQLEIAWKTIIKVLLGVLLAYVAVKLWPLAQLLIVSILVAVPLYRVVLWACRRRWPRWVGLLLASMVLVFALVGLAAVIGPVVVNQVSNLGKNLPKLEQELLKHVPPGPLRHAIERTTSLSTTSSFENFSKQALAAAKTTAGGLVHLVLVVALVVYLMVDGPRALQWLVNFFPAKQRNRVSKGLEQIGDRMVAFIIGQSIISGLFAAYVAIVLSVLHVPMALLLAILAGFLDVVPVLGIAISMTLGVALGLTVSPTTALLVLALYGGYHIFENYFLLPKVYGKHLRLSTLAVIVAMIGGGMVAGVIGAIAVLPLIAAYPALEVLWLSRQLEPEVVKDHQDQLRAA